jgi:UDPglucose 6-dehydrogenase
MRRPVVFDGRNLYQPARIRGAGFIYFSIGRPAVDVVLRSQAQS